MTYKTAAKIIEVFKLDKDYNLLLGEEALSEPISKGYAYANIYFYDEVQKEIQKLRVMIEKIHDEVTMELGLTNADPLRLFFEISTRAHRQIGDDGLDSLVKEFLATKSKHIALMVDHREKQKYTQICEAIFLELTNAFYNMTLHAATDLEDGIKMFKFTNEYVSLMTERQKVLVAPALRIVGLENNVKLNGLQISQDFTVKYKPELSPQPYAKQEEIIKEQIKTFIQKHTD